MNNKSVTINKTSIVLSLISLMFGIVVLAVGIVNTFWGNDPFFGIFLLILSSAYYPPTNSLIKAKIGLEIPIEFKIVLGIFIVWASLGVGELLSKVNLMLMDF